MAHASFAATYGEADGWTRSACVILSPCAPVFDMLSTIHINRITFLGCCNDILGDVAFLTTRSASQSPVNILAAADCSAA